MMAAIVKHGQPGEDPLTTHWRANRAARPHYLWVGPYYVEWGRHGGTPVQPAGLGDR